MTASLEAPSLSREAEFLACVQRSRHLHAPWIAPPDTREAFRRYLSRLQDGRHLGHFVLTSDGELAGVVNLNEIVRGVFQSGYLAYYAFEPHHRQGLMTRSLSLAVTEVFRHHRLHRVEANIQPETDASRALVRRLGFRLEGVSPRYLKIGGEWRDHERWALLGDEWQTRS